MEDDGGNGSIGDRAFFRVKVHIPLRVTPIDEGQYQQLATDVLARIDPPVPVVDASLIGWLDRIERKLDQLLNHHGLLEPALVEPECKRRFDLSGSGLSYTSEKPIAAGSVLQLEFELPETPIRLVRCLGRVAEAGTASVDGEGHLVGVAFETIRQADRDAVVRYTLAVQRQAIRNSSGEMDSQG